MMLKQVNPNTDERYGPYRVHPVADAYWVWEPEHFAELVESIRKNGLRRRIVLGRVGSDGERFLVDGRHRWRALEVIGLDPCEDEDRYLEFVEFEDVIEVMEFAKDGNLMVRRTKNPKTQLAMVAARLVPLFEEAALERMKKGLKIEGLDHATLNTSGVGDPVKAGSNIRISGVELGGDFLLKGRSAELAAGRVEVSPSMVEMALVVCRKGCLFLITLTSCGELSANVASAFAKFFGPEEQEGVLAAEDPVKAVKAAVKDAKAREAAEKGRKRRKRRAPKLASILGRDATESLERVRQSSSHLAGREVNEGELIGHLAEYVLEYPQVLEDLWRQLKSADAMNGNGAASYS